MIVLKIEKLIIINKIQLSALYFFCVTRLGTVKRSQFLISWMTQARMYFFCLVLTLVRNFDSAAKTPLQQRNLITVLTLRAAHSFVTLMASILTRVL